MSERIVTVMGSRSTRPISDFMVNTATEFFVGPNAQGAGSDGRAGRSKDTSLATIAAAIDLCTADKGDVIYLLPGYAATISAAAGMALDVAGISVVGIGHGTLQPTITFDTAITADMDVDAANVYMRNIHFRANFADITAAIDVNADDFMLDACRFSEVATAMNAKIWVQDAAATASDRITIKDCYVTALDAANTHFLNCAGTGDGHVVRDNILIGDWGTMAIGGAGIVTNIVVLNNSISNAASTNDSCINLPATTTGIVMGNKCCGAAGQANGITATACAIAENYYGVVGEDLSAILEPVAT